MVVVEGFPDVLVKCVDIGNNTKGDRLHAAHQCDVEHVLHSTMQGLLLGHAAGSSFPPAAKSRMQMAMHEGTDSPLK